MANSDRNITATMSLDISDLKAGIQEANRQIKLANSEFKNAAAGLDDWSNSADGVTAKLKQLATVEEAEIKKLESLRQQYALIVAEQGETSAAAQNLAARINNQEAAVKKVQREIRTYTDRLEEINQSANQSATATGKLTDEINKQEKELAELKNEYKNVVLEQGESSAAAQELAAKITALNSDLQDNKSKMNEADAAADKLTASMENVGKETKEAGDGFTVAKGALASFIGNAVTAGISKVGELARSMFTLAEETREYRTMLAKVEGSATNFGYSVDFAKEKYKEFYTYLRDDQAATNAITNLMGLGVETERVTNLADGAISVWTAYGDSIPIESLTESITETVNVSKVTGTLADTINWASLTSKEWGEVLSGNTKAKKAFTSAIKEGLPVEDAFNAALAEISDKSERANVVAKMLNETYGESRKTYDQLSGSILEANEAEVELKETQAELAKTLEPLNTEFTKLKTKALKAIAPEVKEITGEFTELIEDIDWSGAASTIGGMLETVGNAAKFTIENLDTIGAVLKTAGAAWLTYKGVIVGATAAEKAMQAAQKITAVVTGATTAATVAQTTATQGATVATKALSLAQKATPWGLVAGLVAGVVTGLVAYIQKSKESEEASDKNTKATKELTEEYKALSDSLEQNAKARAENIQNAAAEAESAGILLNRLEELADKENKSNGEKALMAEYVKQLNELIPDLNLQYDQEADKLNKTTEEIRNQINATKELTKAKAAQEQLAGIASDMAKTEMELAEATKQHEKNQKALTEAQEEYTKAMEAYTKGEKGSSKALNTTYKELKKARENYKETGETVEKLEGNLKKLNKEYDNTEAYAQAKLTAAEVEKALTALIAEAKAAGVDVPKEIANGIKNGKYAVPKSVDELKALIKYDDMIAQAKEAGITVPKSIKDGIKSGELSPSQAVKQMNALVSFNDLLQASSAAGQKVPKWLSKEVLNGKTKPKDAVQIMKDLVTYNDLLDKAKKAGVAVPKNITDGVNSGKMSPVTATDEIKKLMVNKANSAAPEMKTAGQKNAQSLKDGINSKTQEVGSAAANVAQKAVTEVNKKKGSFQSAGANVMQGFKNGITSMVSSVMSTISSIANSAVATVNRKLGIHSPSRVFAEIGRQTMQGFTIGIEEDGKQAIKAVGNMAGELIKEGQRLNNAIPLNSLKTSLSGNLNSLRAGANNPAGRTAGTAPGGGVVNVSFTQNNTSPKALDSLQVYRQTQRQLKQFKALTQGGV